jgi:AraC-like DNA-binding protein
MKTVLTSVDFQEAVLVKEIPDQVPYGQGLIDLNNEITLLGIHGRQKASVLPGICIEQNQVCLPGDVSVFVKKDVPHLELHFELEGYTSFSDSRQTNETITIPQGHGLLLHLPELDGRLNFARNESRKSLEIEFTEEYITTMVEGDLEILGEFGESIRTRTPLFWGNRSFPISPEIYAILTDIANCQYHGILKKIYLESKVREVLLVFLTQNALPPRKNTGSQWNKTDIEKLHAARAIVKQYMAKPYSIHALSKLVGLNEFKLKKGFKELFGTTIFGYLAEIRMQEARILLSESSYSIADISYLVGFKNPQHFTTAFKRTFGILPKRLQKMSSLSTKGGSR